ncbi:MAG TPA: hypothetical protein VF158_00140 [Longimicrobiales bacterium]
MDALRRAAAAAAVLALAASPVGVAAQSAGRRAQADRTTALHGAIAREPTVAPGRASVANPTVARGLTVARDPTAASDPTVASDPTAASGRAAALAERHVDAGGIRPLTAAKWATTAATAAVVVYGFTASLTADGHYDRIARLCAADAGRCRERDGGGYIDPEIARLDAEAERLDRRARVAFLASQVGVAASVALFILDLRDPGAPPNIPYAPARLRIGFAPDGALRVGARLPVR